MNIPSELIEKVNGKYCVRGVWKLESACPGIGIYKIKIKHINVYDISLKAKLGAADGMEILLECEKKKRAIVYDKSFRDGEMTKDFNFFYSLKLHEGKVVIVEPEPATQPQPEETKEAFAIRFYYFVRDNYYHVGKQKNKYKHKGDFYNNDKSKTLEQLLELFKTQQP